MSVLNFIDKQKLDLGTEIAEVPSTDFFDVVSASFESTTDNYIVGAGSRLNSNFINERDGTYKKQTGRDIYNDALNYVEDKESAFNPRTGTLNRDSQVMRDAVDKLIIEKRNNGEFIDESISTYFEINEQAKNKARKSLESYNKISRGAADTTATTAAGLIGGIGATFLDPLNLATLPFGAAGSAGILKTILVEAGINAGIEAASQPFVAEWQREIGNEYGFSEMAENVAIAGLFGGSIGGLVKGAQKSYGHFFSETSVRMKELGESDGAIAAQIMERKAHIDQSDLSRIVRDEVEINYKDVEASLIEANRAVLEEGKINPDNIRIKDQDIMNIDPQKVEPAMRSTVERYQEPEQLNLDTQAKQQDVVTAHEVFDFDDAADANMKAQQELENLYNSPQRMQQEVDAFNELEAIKLDDQEIKILGDTELEDKTIAEILDEMKTSQDYVDALRTCGM